MVVSLGSEETELTTMCSREEIEPMEMRLGHPDMCSFRSDGSVGSELRHGHPRTLSSKTKRDGRVGISLRAEQSSISNLRRAGDAGNVAK